MVSTTTMPHLFTLSPSGHDDSMQETGEEVPPKRPRRSSPMRPLGLGRTGQDYAGSAPPRTRRSSLPEACQQYTSSRPLVPLRQDSERRDKLLTVNADRRRGHSAGAYGRTSPTASLPLPIPSLSVPIASPNPQPANLGNGDDKPEEHTTSPKQAAGRPELSLQIPSGEDNAVPSLDQIDDDDVDSESLQDEYEQRWILNLSMHFRDKSNREKFFVTYAETPYKWRRLTVSLDYRDALDGSLEAELSTLVYQRDKSFKIYEAIRESLPEIQYYNTVTNLKLETTREDGQLHVHVREDINEIIPYPDIGLFRHVKAPRYRESDVEFTSHLSGFVYKVQVDGRTVIKKEIPGPDTVDEFLYEVNALDALAESRHVVDLEGLVTDESGLVVKGLLIAYASQGALVDMLYEYRQNFELSWTRREKWAKQIVEGLSDIHEAGFVQGDFTLSNIVIDKDDTAVIIDINRRGCPVGWEPPELSVLIDSGQRISMCIGVKTDIFQLGMVLWALAEVVDEPERLDRPLPAVGDRIPVYFRHMVESCMSKRPQGRPAAGRLLHQFPTTVGRAPSDCGRSVDFVDEVRLSDHSVSTHRSDKEYIDPNMAITLEDVNARRRTSRDISPFTSEQVEYVDPKDPASDPASTSYRFDSSGSWVVGRGRSPVSSRRRRSSPFARTTSSSATSLSRSPPSRSRPRCFSDSSAEAGIDDVGPEGGVALSRAGSCSIAKPVEDDACGCGGTCELAPTDIKEQSMTNAVAANPRLAAMRHEDVLPSLAFPHTDSGFDESMVEELDIDSSARQRKDVQMEEVKAAHVRNVAATPDVERARPFEVGISGERGDVVDREHA